MSLQMRKCRSPGMKPYSSLVMMDIGWVLKLIHMYRCRKNIGSCNLIWFAHLVNQVCHVMISSSSPSMNTSPIGTRWEMKKYMYPHMFLSMISVFILTMSAIVTRYRKFWVSIYMISRDWSTDESHESLISGECRPPQIREYRSPDMKPYSSPVMMDIGLVLRSIHMYRLWKSMDSCNLIWFAHLVNQVCHLERYDFSV